MAITVYRYRRDTVRPDAALAKLAGAGAANVAAAGGQIADVQIDDAKLSDLDDAMLQLGYTRIATAPVGTPPSQVRESGGTILTLGAVANGQVLTRSGTTIVGGSGSTFALRDNLLFDHFVQGSVASNEIGSCGWILSAAGTGNNQAMTGEADHQGVFINTNGTAATARSAIHLGDTTLRNILASGSNTNPIVFDCMVKPNVSVASANLLRHQMGLGSGWALANPNPLTDGIYIRLEPGTSNNWQGVTANASTRSTVNLGVAAVSTWVRLGFVFTPGGTPSVQFYVNGVATGAAITTNIPVATVLGPGFRSDSPGGGAAVDLLIDYVLISQITP